MLEYDEQTEQRSNSFYRQGFALGYAESNLFVKFRMIKALTKEYTDDQIRSNEPTEGDHSTLLKMWDNSDLCNILDFYRKYENLSEKRLVKRYIAESEYLPWRSF